jgi:hypothetical protein
MFDCFIRYQRQMQKQFLAMQQIYGFEIINANRSPRPICIDLRAKIESLLGLQHAHPEPVLATS